MLQSLRLKDHMETIEIDQSLRKRTLFEDICLININKLYQHAGRCNNQQQFKIILEAAIVSAIEGFTNNSTISLMNLTSVNKPSARKSLCIFTNIVDVKNKTSTC